MAFKGTKQGKTVILDIEPPIADGTEVELQLPSSGTGHARTAQWDALMSAYDSELADNIEQAMKGWRFQEY